MKNEAKKEKKMKIERDGRDVYVDIELPAIEKAEQPYGVKGVFVHEGRTWVEARSSAQIATAVRFLRRFIPREDEQPVEARKVAASSSDYCRRCGGPTSIKGRTCGEC